MNNNLKKHIKLKRFHFKHALLIKTCTLCTYYLISIHISNAHKQTPSTNNFPIFQIEKNISLMYSKTGQLQCKLIAEYIQYSDDTKNIYLMQPSAILFNETKIPTWSIKAQKAKITYDKIMNLYGNVQITNLTKSVYLKSITTNTATLNLITYDIFSNEKTIIHGTRFKTVATNMQGNLKRKFTKLSKEVYTLYEIQNTKKI